MKSIGVNEIVKERQNLGNTSIQEDMGTSLVVSD